MYPWTTKIGDKKKLETKSSDDAEERLLQLMAIIRESQADQRRFQETMELRLESVTTSVEESVGLTQSLLAKSNRNDCKSTMGKFAMASWEAGSLLAQDGVLPRNAGRLITTFCQTAEAKGTDAAVATFPRFLRNQDETLQHLQALGSRV